MATFSVPCETTAHCQLYSYLYYTILYYTILYFTILYYALLCYAMLCYTVLYCAILYYSMLYCTMLSYSMLSYTHTIYHGILILYYTHTILLFSRCCGDSECLTLKLREGGNLLQYIVAICIDANSFYVGVWANVDVRPTPVLLITMFLL